ncbi:SEC-C motif-containing protein [Vibrio crassostreae]|uniref:SEC-C metal-binding domain-containing protein n=1 Tax=Vibrio crassostreae TaxID=246167 RepID=UPI00105393C7|nr:SEC-C metal-binding domain-containing protein [Vibrio crassostreae]TCT58319.1 SEC-C motif-containing protein [Vibrio crassostreae]TCT79090.1 SEC-C motif-containing protein [Vibrio crassostreae]
MQLVNPEIMESPIVADDITDEQLKELVCLISKRRNRNKPCICRSGKKLKHCCLYKAKALQERMKRGCND